MVCIGKPSNFVLPDNRRTLELVPIRNQSDGATAKAVAQKVA